MQDFGLVSIITPSYNSAEFIGETIESIQAQTYPKWELLITDDCSKDNSQEVIKQYANKDPRVKLLALEKNSGAGVARNNSIREAQGRYIAFCDSDDRWRPDKLERQLEFMGKVEAALSYTSYDTFDESDNHVGFVKCLPYLDNFRILRDNGIGCLTAIYDTEKVGKVFMPKIRKRQDWCLWIDIISKCKKAYGLDEPLALYRIRSGSISNNKAKLLKFNYEVYHTVLGYNPLKSYALLFGLFLPYYFYKKTKQKKDFKERIKAL